MVRKSITQVKQDSGRNKDGEEGLAYAGRVTTTLSPRPDAARADGLTLLKRRAEAGRIL